MPSLYTESSPGNLSKAAVNARDSALEQRSLPLLLFAWAPTPNYRTSKAPFSLYSLAFTLSLVGSVTWTSVSSPSLWLALKAILQSLKFEQTLHTKVRWDNKKKWNYHLFNLHKNSGRYNYFHFTKEETRVEEKCSNLSTGAHIVVCYPYLLLHFNTQTCIRTFIGKDMLFFYSLIHCLKKYSLTTYYGLGVPKALTTFQFQCHSSEIHTDTNYLDDPFGMIFRENLHFYLKYQV